MPDRVVARGNFSQARRRRGDPSFHKPRAPGGKGLIDRRDQGVFAAAAEILADLQIPPCCRVDLKGVRDLFADGRPQAGQFAFLRKFKIGDDRSERRDLRAAEAPETVQGEDAEQLVQLSFSHRTVENHRRQRSQ